ncbi:MAG: carbohydrate ABC transporter permease [Actinomycetales bacterium]|nr:carbohydrate ABC transporter permease [Actinomycetales bacterium]
MSSPASASKLRFAKLFRRRGALRKLSPIGYIILAVVTFASIFPFYWMFVVASNGSDEISKNPPTLIPGGNFLKVINDVYSVVDFNRALINTVIVGTVVALAQVFFSALAGFAFAKLNFKGRRGMTLFVIGTMMLPSQLGVIPLFMLVSAAGWFDTLMALIVPALVTAFGVFWMRQIIDAQVPNELLEAASIDGAGVLRAYWSIVLPIIRQSGFVLGLFSFLATWNDFLWPSLVLSSPQNYTAQIAVTQLQASYVLDYALNMGGAFLATVPLLLLFIFVGRKLVSGVMDGAVKG